MNFLIFLLISIASAFDISKFPFDSLLINDDALGIHTLKLSHNTPPSTIFDDWYFLFSKGPSDAAKIGNGCPDDSTICAIISNTFGDNNKDKNLIQSFSLNLDNVNFIGNNNLTANWENVKYGDLNLNVNINFECSDSFDDDIQWIDPTYLIQNDLTFSWKNKYFCSSNGKDNNGDNNNDNNKPKNESSMGFFGSFIIISAIIFAAYLVAQAWYNTSTMGTSSEFLNELFDTVIESLSTIPRILMEIIGKITGSSSSSRGGYSAV